MALDYYLFSLINQFAGQNTYADKTFIFFSEYLVILFILLFLIEFKNVRAVFSAVISSIVVIIADSAVSFFYFIPRPFAAHKVNLLVGHIANASFPSDHAAISFALATSIFIYDPKLGVLAYLLAVLISFSRIFAGLHYPSDIIVGALIGISASYVSAWAVKKYIPT